jgi:hypothetical protein
MSKRAEKVKELVHYLSILTAIFGFIKSIAELKTNLPAFLAVVDPALLWIGRFTWGVFYASVLVYVLFALTNGIVKAITRDRIVLNVWMDEHVPFWEFVWLGLAAVFCISVWLTSTSEDLTDAEENRFFRILGVVNLVVLVVTGLWRFFREDKPTKRKRI